MVDLGVRCCCLSWFHYPDIMRCANNRVSGHASECRYTPTSYALPKIKQIEAYTYIRVLTSTQSCTHKMLNCICNNKVKQGKHLTRCAQRLRKEHITASPHALHQFLPPVSSPAPARWRHSTARETSTWRCVSTETAALMTRSATSRPECPWPAGYMSPSHSHRLTRR